VRRKREKACFLFLSKKGKYLYCYRGSLVRREQPRREEKGGEGLVKKNISSRPLLETGRAGENAV